MFCHEQDYLKIAKIQYKALKIVYNSNQSYEELLLRNKEVSIHQKQLRILVDLNPKQLRRFKSRFYEIIFYNKRNTLLLKKWRFFENTISTLYMLWNKFNFISSMFSVE